MKHSDYLNYMYNQYNQYNKNSNFSFENDNIQLSEKLYKEDLNNGVLKNTKHYELLRLIINYIIEYEDNTDYLLFLQSLLFSLLEENGISLIYQVPRNSDLNNKLFKLDREYRHYSSKDENGKYRLFYHPGKGTSISNTQIYFLIKAILKKQRKSKSRSRSRSRSPKTKRQGGRKRNYNKKLKSRKKK